MNTDFLGWGSFMASRLMWRALHRRTRTGFYYKERPKPNVEWEKDRGWRAKYIGFYAHRHEMRIQKGIDRFVERCSDGQV